MTENEWRADVLGRISRLESADIKMQGEISEIKEQVLKLAIVTQNMETQNAERLQRIQEKTDERLQAMEDRIAAKQDRTDEKVDTVLNASRNFSRAFWLAIIAAVVTFIMKGGLAI